MLILSEPLAVVTQVAEAFDQLKVKYLVGGSRVTYIYGTARDVRDVYLVADLSSDKVEDFCAILKDAFHTDANRILDAVHRRVSFKIVHLSTRVAPNVYIMKDTSWSREQMSRVREEKIEGLGVALPIASPEDVVLQKLVWCRIGKEVAHRPWSDILVILRVQGSLLDQQYLDHWANILNVSQLLERARAPN